MGVKCPSPLVMKVTHMTEYSYKISNIAGHQWWIQDLMKGGGGGGGLEEAKDNEGGGGRSFCGIQIYAYMRNAHG